MRSLLLVALAAAALVLPARPAAAQTSEITIGISISTTGPGAALGVPERNALEFVPKEIAGVPLKLIVLDDGGDPTNATTNARRFVTESRADDRDLQCRQRGRHSAYKPRAFPGNG
jgi:branched-chain amino acid transport system substrate-binding protein